MVCLFLCAPGGQFLAEYSPSAAINCAANRRSYVKPPKTGRRVAAPARPAILPGLKTNAVALKPAAESRAVAPA